MPDREKVITEIEDALSGNLAKAGYVYRMSLNGLKDKALKDALALLKGQPEIILCKDCQNGGIDSTSYPEYWCSAHSEYHDGEFFCAYGKQKDS